MEIVHPYFSKEKNAVCVSFAVNEAYAFPLRVVIYTLLKHKAAERYYDILIMHKSLTAESQTAIQTMVEKEERVSIRFIDMTENEKAIQITFPEEHYLSIETCYRLFLVTNMFCEYEKMVYLDCDTLLFDDVSELYDTKLDGYLAGAVTEYSFRYNQSKKNPIFVDNEPYSMDGYCKDVVGTLGMEDYFNAGVLVLNLTALRQCTSIEEMLTLLVGNPYIYYDQDVLNHVIKGNYIHLDVGWNYLNYYHFFRDVKNPDARAVFEDCFRNHPKLIHYVGEKKPWREKDIMLDEHYRKILDEMGY